ncbi:hypothetical protein COPG_00142 [Colwellia phage 9A]|uniref:Uncharacterized protein n=1 Tax=Colwellia phage 9A TaxID=765765 RepID=I3UMM3_9CAUD|nr:hypothetical protein COPG_00142 [Colwellia phage 9A]AFK66738.1 hypothetical protein COPG_00142 [Colwellia phage 9A]
MIIDNAKGQVKRHSKSGRPLNLFNKNYSDKAPLAKVQKTMDDLFFGKIGNVSVSRAFDYFTTANELSVKYKLSNKSFTNKRIVIFQKFIMWCFLNIDETLQIKIIPSIVSRDMLKFIVEDLEKLGYVEIYDGFPIIKGDKRSAVQRAIKPTLKLRKLRDKTK